MPLTTPWAHGAEHAPAERADLLLAWARSGVLTFGEAELLMALDESTPWNVRA